MKRGLRAGAIAGAVGFALAFGLCWWMSTLPAVTDVSTCWAFRPWWRISNWLMSLAEGAGVGAIAGLLAAFRPRAGK